ncbi:MAG: MFS transporter [bacterium]
MWVIVILGFVSLLSDFTYESFRSFAGPFFASLGANSFYIGLIGGLAYFISYSFRLPAGYIADKFKSYLATMNIGYYLLLCIPLIAFFNSIYTASTLFLLERLGKSIRTPSRDFIISIISQQSGISQQAGKMFGIHQFLDQIGAITGPLFVSLLLSNKINYTSILTFLFIPSILSMFLLLILSYYITQRKLLHYNWSYNTKSQQSDNLKKINLEKIKMIYILSCCMICLGFLDFSIISFYWEQKKVISLSFIPLLYSLAMFVSAIGAFLLGLWFDKNMIISSVSAMIFFLFTSLFILADSIWIVFIGVLMWGISIAFQGCIIKATFSKLLNPMAKDWGMLYTFMGISFLIGNSIMGYLISFSTIYTILFSIVSKLIGILLMREVFKV